MATALNVPARPIVAYVGGLLAAILVLKLFQPSSVAVYYSEELQDAYVSYREGGFDHFLAKEQRGNLSPLLFAEWYHRTYEPMFSRRHAIAIQSTATESREHEEELQAAVLDALNGSTLNPIRRERRLLNA